MITDREDVINLHMGIPKHNGFATTCSCLWSGSALNNYFYSSPNDIGPGNNQFIYSFYGTHAQAPTCGPEQVAPGLTVNGCTSSGQIQSYGDPTRLCQSSTDLDRYRVRPPTAVLRPTYVGYAETFRITCRSARRSRRARRTSKRRASTWRRARRRTRSTVRSRSIDNAATSIGTTPASRKYSTPTRSVSRPICGSTATRSTPTGCRTTRSSASQRRGSCPCSRRLAEYQLITHTSGGALELPGPDQRPEPAQPRRQLHDRRRDPVQQLPRRSTACSVADRLHVEDGRGFTCYDPTTGSVPDLPEQRILRTSLKGTTSSGHLQLRDGKRGPVPRFADLDGNCHRRSDGLRASGTPAARAGATWDSLWQRQRTGSLQHGASAIHQRRAARPVPSQRQVPDQRLDPVRQLSRTTCRTRPTAANIVLRQQTANYTCVLASTNQVLTAPLRAGQPPPAAAQYVNGDCNKAAVALIPTGPKTGWVHPNGTTQDGVAAPNFTASSPGSYAWTTGSRVSRRPTRLKPDTVFRASAGRFTQPPISASVQYLSAVRRQPLAVEQHDEPRVLLAVPPDSGHLVGAVRPVVGAASQGNGHELQAHAVLHVGEGLAAADVHRRGLRDASPGRREPQLRRRVPVQQG